MSKAKKLVASPPKGQVVEVVCPAGTTKEQLVSQVAVEGVLANAATVLNFSLGQVGEGNALHAVELLRKSIEVSKNGDLSVADTLLIGQATALNAISHEMFRRAWLNAGEHLEAMDLYMRLGLKAQSQCRATLESLAKIKNPPNVAFVKQANIAHGHQQVNNGVQSGGDGAVGRVEKTETPPIELLENGNGEWMDTGATGAPGTCDSAMEAVGEVHRPTHGSGQSRHAK